MQTPSSTTKLLAGMPASKAAAERVFYLKENLNIPSQIADSGLGHGQCFRARGSASGREIAARGQSGRSIGPCVSHLGAQTARARPGRYVSVFLRTPAPVKERDRLCRVYALHTASRPAGFLLLRM